ncbi:hypothetical protein [Nocardia camponoti]|uniref:Serine hydrolase n=1 Tax=Nocardia camponoti TaxID=1616106 RepID=A0A917QCF9_9NOCA|nr:hypothetical protein [Nocardia camponoti]GGK43730.1 hypothetical protein GCM10011591_14170 [Nocardia camponoti]
MFIARHRRVITLLATAATAFTLVSGCAKPPREATPTPTVTVPTIAPDPGAVVGPGVSIALPGSLAADFAAARASFRGTAGLTIMPVGGDKMVTFGDWTTGPAWSTMKVPLAVAVLRRGSTYASAASTAITASDNDAADTLWQSLGAGDNAAKAVEEILREGGDPVTTVPPTRTRSDASAFGQADWSLANQVRFAANLPCLPGNERVVGYMGQITPSHRWGLGAFNSADFKGGWGPDTSGKYLVRQFGLIDTPSGRVAVAFAAQPDSGAFNDGMTMLDKLAAVIGKHLTELGGGRCP